MAEKEQQLPPEAGAAYESPMSEKMKLLVALCYQLQVVRGTAPFFLSSRDGAKLLEVAHTTVFCWLEILADEDGPFRLLKKVSTGNFPARKANEYRYLPRRHTSCA
jgi:hypothetical protein